MIGDVARLSCVGIVVLVQVGQIEGEYVVGTVLGFENSDAESIGGVECSDDVRFHYIKVQDWHRPQSTLGRRRRTYAVSED